MGKLFGSPKGFFHLKLASFLPLIRQGISLFDPQTHDEITTLMGNSFHDVLEVCLRNPWADS
jgi:hypothetical protein